MKDICSPVMVRSLALGVVSIACMISFVGKGLMVAQNDEIQELRERQGEE